MAEKEYIEREAVLSVLDEAVKTWRPDIGISKAEYFRIRYKNIPAADVRPVVHGKWLLDTLYTSGVKKFRCSICGYERTVHEKYEGVFRINFCPNCGADMREES